MIDEVEMLGRFAAACEMAAHGPCDARDFADLMQRADGYRRLQEMTLDHNGDISRQIAHEVASEMLQAGLLECRKVYEAEDRIMMAIKEECDGTI